jgi:hypothetical protein
MARGKSSSMKACCLISEMLEEAGFDREKARRLRRQILEGVIMLCRWQLERMEATAAAPASSSRRRPTKVPLD